MKSLIIILTISMSVSSAQAKYSGGTGEPNDPYKIATATDLIALGETPEDYDKHFILISDINLDPNLPGRKVFDRAVISPDMDTNTVTVKHLLRYGSIRKWVLASGWNGSGWRGDIMNFEKQQSEMVLLNRIGKEELAKALVELIKNDRESTRCL